MQTCFTELLKENFLLWSKVNLQVNFSLLNTEQRKRLQGAEKMPTAQFKDYKMNFFDQKLIWSKNKKKLTFIFEKKWKN